MAHLLESGELTIEDVKEAERALRKKSRKGEITTMLFDLSSLHDWYWPPLVM